MKLFCCFLISSLCGIVFCQAQISFSVKAGAAASNLINTDLMWQGHPIPTGYAGAASTLKMGKRFFFQPELLYSERGSKMKAQSDKLVRSFGYISMPLLLGWHPFKNMSLLIGAEPGYMVWDHNRDNFYVDDTYRDVDRRFNVDIDLGLAYQVLPRWRVEVHSVAGIIGIYEEWGQGARGFIYKTGEYVGTHYMIQFGLSYDLKTKNNKASR